MNFAVLIMNYLVSLHRKSNQTMEKDNENTLLKIRSSRACIRDGYMWFSDKFRRIFRHTWPIALLFAVLTATASALPVLISPLLLWPALALELLAVIILLVLTRRVFRKKQLLPPAGSASLGAKIRQAGQFVLVGIVCLLVVAVLTLLTSLPTLIMMAANWESQMGVLNGDPAGMPDYVLWLSIVVFLIAGFLKAYVWMTIICPFYLVRVTVAQKEKEKKEFNIEKL